MRTAIVVSLVLAAGTWSLSAGQAEDLRSVLQDARRAPGETATAEWSQWRGPSRDGHSDETGLLQQWPQNGPPRVWQASISGRS
jgi:hypothetical protein